MKKFIWAIILVGAAAVAYWLLSPLFYDREVSEVFQMTPESSVIRSGVFTGLANHQASGTAKLIKSGDKYIVRLDDDFRVTNGPDLFVHFGKKGEYSAEARLGALKGNVGGQNYEVPPEIDPSQYDEIWIWCRSFFVPFGVAVLN